MESKIKFLGSTYNEHSRWGLFDSSGICPTLTAAMGMGDGYVPMILEINKMDKVNVIGKMDNTLDHTFESANRIYDIEGLCPTIPTCAGGGIQPKILEKNDLKMINIPQTVVIRKYDIDTSLLKELLRKQKKECGLSCKEIAEQLNIPLTQVEHFFRIDDFFAIPEPNVWKPLANLLNIHDSELDMKIMTFEEKEGVYEKSERHYLDSGISPTIMTSNNDKIVCKEYKEKMNEEHKINRVGQISNEGSQYGSMLSEKGLSATLSAGTHGYSNNCIQQKYRIRKLTPKECFRLMNFDDTDFYAAESVNSNTRLYSQAGNSIVVGCLAAIFSQLNIKGVTPWNEMSLEQKYDLIKINKCNDPGYEKNIL